MHLVKFNFVNECVTNFSIINLYYNLKFMYNSILLVRCTLVIEQRQNSSGNLTELRSACSWIKTDYRMYKIYSRIVIFVFKCRFQTK